MLKILLKLPIHEILVGNGAARFEKWSCLWVVMFSNNSIFVLVVQLEFNTKKSKLGSYSIYGKKTLVLRKNSQWRGMIAGLSVGYENQLEICT